MAKGAMAVVAVVAAMVLSGCGGSGCTSKVAAMDPACDAKSEEDLQNEDLQEPLPVAEVEPPAQPSSSGSDPGEEEYYDDPDPFHEIQSDDYFEDLQREAEFERERMLQELQDEFDAFESYEDVQDLEHGR